MTAPDDPSIHPALDPAPPDEPDGDDAPERLDLGGGEGDEPPGPLTGEERELFVAVLGEVDPRARAWLARRTRSAADAEDLWAESHAQAHLKCDQCRNRTREGFRGWIWVVVRNRWCKDVRRRKLRGEHTTLGKAEGRPDGSAGTTTRADVDVVERIVSTFREAEQLLFRLHYHEGLSYAELADQAGSSEAAMKQRCYRMRTRVAEAARAEGVRR